MMAACASENGVAGRVDPPPNPTNPLVFFMESSDGVFRILSVNLNGGSRPWLVAGVKARTVGYDLYTWDQARG